MNNQEIKNSIFGYLSFGLGLVNLIITLVIVIALNKITNGIPSRNIISYVDILNTFSVIESYTKAIGVLLGVIGVLYKSSKKTMAIIGLGINIISIVWTILVLI